MRAVPLEPGNRLNVLLTAGDDIWSQQLPRLLEPQGVRALRVRDVDEAMKVIAAEPIHAAVIDMELPMRRTASPSNPSQDATPDTNPRPTEGSKMNRPGQAPRPQGQVETGGLKLLRVIHRLDPTPPAVVVRGRMFDRRIDTRLLSQALRLDVFSVLDQPVQLEQMLEVLRRLLERYYGGLWPDDDKDHGPYYA